MRTRLLTVLCIVYAGLLLYGSLMPFNFTNGPEVVRENLDRAFLFWPCSSVLHTSFPDALANTLLYIPLGALVSMRLTARRDAWRIAAAAAALLVGAAISLTVEGLQLWEPSRVGAVNDLVTNSLGALIGGLAGGLWGRRLWLSLRRAVRCRLNANPVILGAWVVMFVLFSDATYPFLPTQDVSDLKHSIQRAIQLCGMAGFEAHPWHYWLIMRVAVYAALTALLASGLGSASKPRWIKGASWTLAFAIAIELAKLIIVARNPNPANVIMSGCGILAALVLGTMLRGRVSSRGKYALAIVLLAACIAYLSWEPFNFSWNMEYIRSRIPRGPEWIPLYEYAMQGRGEQVFLVVRSLAALGGLTYAITMIRWRFPSNRRWSRVLRGAMWAGLIGLVSELGQFLLPGRIPSLTDVVCFAAGGAIGAWFAQIHQIKIARNVRVRDGIGGRAAGEEVAGRAR
jgi:VanZ family protein